MLELQFENQNFLFLKMYPYSDNVYGGANGKMIAACIISFIIGAVIAVAITLLVIYIIKKKKSGSTTSTKSS